MTKIEQVGDWCIKNDFIYYCGWSVQINGLMKLIMYTALAIFFIKTLIEIGKEKSK